MSWDAISQIASMFLLWGCLPYRHKWLNVDLCVKCVIPAHKVQLQIMSLLLASSMRASSLNQSSCHGFQFFEDWSMNVSPLPPCTQTRNN